MVKLLLNSILSERIIMISKSSEIKISIITASYNYARYISETIESVIKQSYQNWK